MFDFETESLNPKSTNLDQIPVCDILRIMNEEDAIVPLSIRDQLSNVEQIVKMCIDSLQKGGRIVYAGAGTSGRMAIVDAVETIPTFNAPPEWFTCLMAGGERAFTQAVEAVEDQEEAGKKAAHSIPVHAQDTVIGISASGRTPFVAGVFQAAQQVGASRGLICNVSRPALQEEAQIVVSLLTGPEVLTGSTRLKAGTSQKMVLNMISTATMVKMGKVFGNLMVDVLTMNQKLRTRAVKMVSLASGADEVASQQALEKCNWHPKTAILMLLLDLQPDQARSMLQDHGGFIRKALSQQKSSPRGSQ
ncbi:MAG TPA: N-acetylmuramic acid 6-phosphate etherase [Thermotogota bacterium]|nr:N-acetylmuramic acid 6-phosphate etherase [Thermotogota bacterium]HRW93176.1 N-acetylmuramic acid 6-phosphate etherase [Thermotogota bacterium]